MGRAKRKKNSSPRKGEIKSSLADAVRQLAHPPEHRIAPPRAKRKAPAAEAAAPAPPPAAPATPMATDGSARLDQLINEMANCLWYVKTKYFRREWDDDDNADDDPRVRRALSRLNRGKDAFARAGALVRDPINSRYHEGSEGLMRPVQLQPVPGLRTARVSETITPIVFRDDILIQRGEVIVEVPAESSPEPRDPTTRAALEDMPQRSADDDSTDVNGKGNGHAAHDD